MSPEQFNTGTWFDESGNEYRDHIPVSYGAVLKEAMKRAEQNKPVYPDAVTPGMRDVIKSLLYSRVEEGGIAGDVREKDIIFALNRLSEAHGWKQDNDIDVELVRAEVVEDLKSRGDG